MQGFLSLQRSPDLRQRTISSIPMLLVGGAALWFGGHLFAVLVAIACGLMVWEWRRMVLGRGIPPLDLRLLLPAALVAGGLLLSSAGQLSVLLVLACALGLRAFYVCRRGGGGWFELAGLFWISAAGLALLYLRSDPGAGFITALWLVGVVIATDIGGYFTGRLIGGPKLSPRISPKKTWSGLMGSLVGALIVGALVSFFIRGPAFSALGTLTLFTSLAAVGGDLLESVAKRHFGVKDSSDIIPGHGGVLDRLDGLMGAALFVVTLVVLSGGVRPLW